MFEKCWGQSFDFEQVPKLAPLLKLHTHINLSYARITHDISHIFFPVEDEINVV